MFAKGVRKLALAKTSKGLSWKLDEGCLAGGIEEKLVGSARKRKTLQVVRKGHEDKQMNRGGEPKLPLDLFFLYSGGHTWSSRTA